MVESGDFVYELFSIEEYDLSYGLFPTEAAARRAAVKKGWLEEKYRITKRKVH